MEIATMRTWLSSQGTVEDCDGIDNNCNEVVDEGFSNLDGDELADCVDIEECDGVDNDGDGQIDEGFEDIDGDGLSDCIDAEDCGWYRQQW